MPAPDVAVVGGGLIGLAIARELARGGLAVTLVERGALGAESSSAGAGMLAPLGEAEGPLGPVARAARDAWPAWAATLAAESGVAIELPADGSFVVALDETEDAELGRLSHQGAEAGEFVHEVAVAEVRRQVPDLTPVARRALHLPGELRVDNVAALAALTGAARQAGVEFCPGTEVLELTAPPAGVELHTLHGRLAAGAVVIATGAWCPRLPGGLTLPIHPVRGQMLRLEGVAWPWAGIVRRPRLYAVRRGAEGLLIGATVEPEAGFAKQVTPAGLAQLGAWVQATFPALAQAPVSATWAGLRPGSPDGLPLLGPLPGAANIWLATGHYRNGILLAPWTARALVTALRAGSIGAALAPFSPARCLYNSPTSGAAGAAERTVGSRRPQGS